MYMFMGLLSHVFEACSPVLLTGWRHGDVTNNGGEPPFSVGEFFQLLGYILGTLMFIVLIRVDMHDVFKKGAHCV